MIDTLPAILAMTAALTTKGKENPYAKAGFGKCYKCGEPGRRSNESPKRSPVNMEDYEDKVQIETEPKNFEFIEEDGEVATCVVQRLLCNQKNPDTTQRHQIF